MYDNNSKGISYSAGFFILIAFAIAALLLAGAITIPIWTSMTGKSFKEMAEGMSDPANSNAVKIIQCMTEIIVFFIPAVIVAMILNKRPMKLLGFSVNISWKQIGLAVLIVFIALFVSAALSYLNDKLPIDPSWRSRFDKMELEYNRQVEAIIGLNSTGQYILALIIMAFVPALCEETLFRGGLQNFLTRSTRMPWLSILVVSLLFSLAHLSYYGFLSRFFLGVILGFLYQYSGKIWLNIIAHFLNNALALTAIYVYKLQGKSINESIRQTDTSSWQGIFALPVLIVLLYLFYKVSAVPKDEPRLFVFEEEKEKPRHGI